MVCIKYQRVLGAVTTFTSKDLRGEEITVYGDGSVVRDLICIDDAFRATLNIVDGDNNHRIFNLSCGFGTSIKQLIQTINETLGVDIKVIFQLGRKVDVPINYLDISRYESAYGKHEPTSLFEEIKKTAEFIKTQYNIEEDYMYENIINQ
jgi:UDP-glucose 4-epimerase